MHDTIIILDFGSQTSQLIARRVREHQVYSELLPWDVDPERVKALHPKGFILSGGPNSVYATGAPQAPAYVLESGLPVSNTTREDVKSVLNLFYDNFTPLARRVIHRADNEFDMSAISLTVYTEDKNEAWELYDQINDFIRPLEEMRGSGVTDIKVTGSSILTAVIIDAITVSQANSILVTLIVSLIVLTIIFYIEERSLTLGAVALSAVAWSATWFATCFVTSFVTRSDHHSTSDPHVETTTPQDCDCQIVGPPPRCKRSAHQPP